MIVISLFFDKILVKTNVNKNSKKKVTCSTARNLWTAYLPNLSLIRIMHNSKF